VLIVRPDLSAQLLAEDMEAAAAATAAAAAVRPPLRLPAATAVSAERTTPILEPVLSLTIRPGMVAKLGMVGEVAVLVRADDADGQAAMAVLKRLLG
jgi:hypothetical protein